MTKDEAKNLLLNAAWLGTDETREKTEEAVRMAIDALSQQTAICPSAGIDCGDCPAGDYAISNQAVRALICRNNDKYGYSDRFHEFTEECLNLPPVTPAEKVGKWIPVSERLPEDKTYVLTTIKVPNRIAHARSGWYEGGFFHNDNGDVWKATDMEVVAWMPLSAPYHGEVKI